MTTPRRGALALLLSLAAAASAHAVPQESIPTPRPGGWSVDLTGTLRAEDLQALDRLGEEVRAQTGAELGVVIVGSTDGAPHRQYATDLANRWGIGDAEKDNGVLVFAALEDRAAEIVLGDGIDDPERTRIAEEIMQGEMVPRFRAGEPGGAVFYGALACARRILGAVPTAAGMPSESAAAPGASAGTLAMPFSADTQPAPMRDSIPAMPEPEPSPRSELEFPLLLVVGGLVLVGIVALLVYLLRSPRKCRSCGVPMVRLDEGVDGAHLEPAERIEEQVGSVDYDVWACPSCQRVEKFRHGAWFTRYAYCPQCGARTVSSAEQTEQRATRWSEGSVRVTEDCAHCDYQHVFHRAISRLPEPNYDSTSDWSPSSGSSSSSTRPSSFSSSSSSSSSSSGFSGGSSSGGGASGRW